MASGDRQEAANLVVVGASLAGMVAAVTAADHGHRVVLLERGKDLGGGAAATESEAIAAAGTRFQRVADVDDGPGRLLADLSAGAGQDLDMEVARALVEHSSVLVEWLADRCGAQVSLQSKTPAHGHGAPRLHAASEQGGAGLAATLVRAASHHTHIRVRAGTEVERLLVDGTGAVLGVAVRPDRRGPSTIAGPVVLACGGFIASDELVGQHCPAVKDLPYMGTAGGKGDALRLALGCAIASRNLGACAVSALVAQPSHFALPVAIVERGAILVNQLGARFTDETADPLPLALTVRAQPGRLAYLVFDERIATAVADADPFFARVVLPRTSRRAGSVGMLAKQLELPAGALDATLAAYNAGSDPVARARARASIEPPLYGVRVTGARRATLGGLAVDPSARVLGDTGTLVPNLFAIGGAADGISAGIAALPGMDALVALGMARLAALSLGKVEEA